MQQPATSAASEKFNCTKNHHDTNLAHTSSHRTSSNPTNVNEIDWVNSSRGRSICSGRASFIWFSHTFSFAGRPSRRRSPPYNIWFVIEIGIFSPHRIAAPNGWLAGWQHCITFVLRRRRWRRGWNFSLLGYTQFVTDDFRLLDGLFNFCMMILNFIVITLHIGFIGRCVRSIPGWKGLPASKRTFNTMCIRLMVASGFYRV